MNLINRLSVGRRLTVGFGAIAALIAASALASWLQLTDLKTAVVDVMDDRYPKVDLARDIFDSVNTQARMLRNAIVATSLNKPAEADGFLAEQERAVSENNERMEKLKAMVNTPRGQEMFAAMSAARGEYGAVAGYALLAAPLLCTESIERLAPAACEKPGRDRAVRRRG